MRKAREAWVVLSACVLPGKHEALVHLLLLLGWASYGTPLAPALFPIVGFGLAAVLGNHLDERIAADAARKKGREEHG